MNSVALKAYRSVSEIVMKLSPLTPSRPKGPRCRIFAVQPSPQSPSIFIVAVNSPSSMLIVCEVIVSVDCMILDVPLPTSYHISMNLSPLSNLNDTSVVSGVWMGTAIDN